MCLPVAHYLELKLKCVFDQALRLPLTCPGLLGFNLAINAGLSHHTAPQRHGHSSPHRLPWAGRCLHPLEFWRWVGMWGLASTTDRNTPAGSIIPMHRGLGQGLRTGGLRSAGAMLPQPTAEAKSVYSVIKAHSRGLQPSPCSLSSSGTVKAR